MKQTDDTVTQGYQQASSTSGMASSTPNNTQGSMTAANTLGSSQQTQSSTMTPVNNGQQMQSGTAMQTTNANQMNAQAGTQQTVVAIFDNRQQAETAIQQLRNGGFSQEEINLVTKAQSNANNNAATMVDDDITDGAIAGGALGGAGGMLLGAGALTLPGLGAVLAMGPIATAVGGAIAGGLAGGLIDWGIPEERGKDYENKVAKGSTLVVVRTTQGKANQALQVLQTGGSHSVTLHA